MLKKLLFNLFLPPFGTRVAKNQSRGKLEYAIYSPAHDEALIGFFLGLTAVSGIILSALVSTNVFSSLIGTSLFTLGLPLFIGIPWLFSVIGKAWGFYSTINGFNYKTKNAGIFLALTFGLIGDTFFKDFYAYFTASSAIQNFLRKANELGLLKEPNSKKFHEMMQFLNNAEQEEGGISGYYQMLISLNTINYFNSSEESRFYEIFKWSPESAAYISNRRSFKDIAAFLQKFNIVTIFNIHKFSGWLDQDSVYQGKLNKIYF
jgi:hypothetical protein